MFDTMKVAKKIREARIAQNMTQMNLADAMEVSYQAVSNWERGNSMPDISKLEQLCNILHISFEELLGTDTSAKTIVKIIQNELTDDESSEPVGISLDEVADIFPLLPPVQIKKIVEENTGEEGEESVNLSAIIGLAPFLDEEYLEELVKKARVNSLREVAALAPFLSEGALDSLVCNAPDTDMAGIISLAPFLGQVTLDKLVLRFNGDTNPHAIHSLAPFLSEQALDSLVDSYLANGHSIEGLSGLYPFLSQKTLRKFAEHLMKKGDLNELQSIVPFL